MNRNGKPRTEVASEGSETVDRVEAPRSVQIASVGIDNSAQAKSFLSALITDVMTESVSTKMAGAACNAMGKLIKIADLERKHSGSGTSETFTLVDRPGQHPVPISRHDPMAERRAQLLRELAELESASEPVPGN